MTSNDVFIIIITCFIFTAFITPYIIRLAFHIGAVDNPNKRKVHKKQMPRLGGLSIFLGFLLGYMIFSAQSVQMISILIGGFIIILTGIVDDIKPLPASVKLI